MPHNARSTAYQPGPCNHIFDPGAHNIVIAKNSNFHIPLGTVVSAPSGIFIQFNHHFHLFTFSREFLFISEDN